MGQENNTCTTGREEQLVEVLEDLRDWCDAYPVNIWPEPDLVRVRELLAAGGITLDAVSASMARWVLRGIRERVEAVLNSSQSA